MIAMIAFTAAVFEAVAWTGALYLLAEPIAEGTPEETDKDRHGAKYQPYLKLSSLNIFHTVESERRKSGESTAETCHTRQIKDLTAIAAPGA